MRSYMSNLQSNFWRSWWRNNDLVGPRPRQRKRPEIMRRRKASWLDDFSIYRLTRADVRLTERDLFYDAVLTVNAGLNEGRSTARTRSAKRAPRPKPVGTGLRMDRGTCADR